MSRIDDLITVIELACLTEDRSNQEQLAMLRIARWVDNEANKNTVDNKWMWGDKAGSPDAVRQRPPLCLENMVDQSRVLVDNQKPVRLPERGKKARVKHGPVQQRFGDAPPAGSTANRKVEETAPL